MSLYVDVTQLIHWQGKLTGIPRVMNELADRYKDEVDTHFITWESTALKYVGVDINKSLKDRGVRLHYSEDVKVGRKVAVFLLRVLRKLNKLGIYTPEGVTTYIKKSGNLTKGMEFTDDDVLLVLWGEQGSEAFITEILNLHKKQVKIIQVSYDLLPLVTPQYSGHSTRSMDSYNRQVFPVCDLLLSISEYTKQDIIKWLKERSLGIPPIQVFRLGDDFTLSQSVMPVDHRFKKGDFKNKDFLLTVGTIEARKNHTLLYYTYKLACSKGIELPKIIIVGRQGWMAENVYQLMKLDPDVNTKMFILEDVSDNELSWLYSNAILTIYPSFYEGWGLPIAESIAHGTPVICSNTSSMPEVAGDLVTYFNPSSVEECLETIQNILKPDVLSLAKKKITQYKPTSWDQTFEQVNNFIKEAV